MKRPIIITYPFVLGEANGGARMTREIARHLGRCGEQVILMPVSRSLFHPDRVQEFLGQEFDAGLAQDNVRLARVGAHPLSAHLDGLQVRAAVGEQLHTLPPRIVLSYYEEGAFLPGMLEKAQIPFGFISTWQSYGMARPQRRSARPGGAIRRLLHARLVERPHRRARILFATSGFTKSELHEVLGVDLERIRVCYLGVDPLFTEIPRPNPGMVPRFLYFGRLVPSKGIRDALMALQLVKARGHSQWRFRLFGSGKRAWVLGLVSRLGLEQHVEVHPAIPTDRLLDELSQADFALMPSHAEAFGLSIAEAQAAGLPVLAYAAGSVPEIVLHEQTGLLAPLRDVEQLAAAILRVLQHPDEARRMGQAARQRVRAMFTWEKTAAAILAGIEDLEK